MTSELAAPYQAASPTGFKRRSTPTVIGAKPKGYGLPGAANWARASGISPSENAVISVPSGMLMSLPCMNKKRGAAGKNTMAVATIAPVIAAPYREMSKPFESAEAPRAAVQALLDQIGAARVAARIADVHVVVRVTAPRPDGTEGLMVASGHYGDELKGEEMLAWEMGNLARERVKRLAGLMGGKVTVGGEVAADSD